MTSYNPVQVEYGNTNKKLNLNNISWQEGKDIATFSMILLLLVEKYSSSLVPLYLYKSLRYLKRTFWVDFINSLFKVNPPELSIYAVEKLTFFCGD